MVCRSMQQQQQAHLGGEAAEELPMAGWGPPVGTPGAPEYAGAKQEGDEDDELGSPQEIDLDEDIELSPAY